MDLIIASPAPPPASHGHARFALVALFLASLLPARAAEPASADFNFQEVYNLLKANLAGASDTELNRAAVRGLVNQLGGRVSIVGEPAPGDPAAANAGPVSGLVFDGRFACLRLTRLSSDTDQRFDSTLRQIASTNTIKGIILDLRFASGQDYAAAVAVADRFLATEESLVDWGEGWKKSRAKTDAVRLPMAILINRQTRGSAEVLAGILRQHDLGLLIGTQTAGQAAMAREFTLKTGQHLRVAVAPVKVAEQRELPFTGLKPDIDVQVSPEDERAWYDDSFKQPSKPVRAGVSVGVTAGSTNELNLAGTNRPRQRRLNEAELVRMTRDGLATERDRPSAATPGRPGENLAPVITDPAMIRALDLLKGLAVVHQFRGG